MDMKFCFKSFKRGVEDIFELRTIGRARRKPMTKDQRSIALCVLRYFRILYGERETIEVEVNYHIADLVNFNKIYNVDWDTLIDANDEVFLKEYREYIRISERLDLKFATPKGAK